MTDGYKPLRCWKCPHKNDCKVKWAALVFVPVSVGFFVWGIAASIGMAMA